jgi:valyl-tRNA synthetase
MLGLKFMGQVPFRDVYIHALVRDAEGQKMSKSKGNVIDPLHVMDEFGTDALRFTLASMASPGRDIKLAEERIEGYRNFANKVWNAARFILMNLDGPRETAPPAEQSFPNQWILSQLNQTIQKVTESLEQYRFDQAASHLYQFIWRDYCDWYLEMIKPALQDKLSVEATRTRAALVETFETVQRLLHPFMPFITEEIWQTLPHEGESIVTQPYPLSRSEWNADAAIDQEFEHVHQFVVTMRTMRALLNYQPGKIISAFGTAQSDHTLRIVHDHQSHIAHLGRATLRLAPIQQWPAKNVLRWPVGGLTVGILVEGDVDLRKALDRSKKERDEKLKEISRIESKLNNPDFRANAPREVTHDHEHRLQVLKTEATQLADSEQQLQAMLGV